MRFHNFLGLFFILLSLYSMGSKMKKNPQFMHMITKSGSGGGGVGSEIYKIQWKYGSYLLHWPVKRFEFIFRGSEEKKE